jgi:hypothetical protein
MRFDLIFVYFRGRQVHVATVQKLLCLNYPHLIMRYVVKTEVKKGMVICHVDWQGVFQQKFFQIIIHNLTADDKEKNIEGQD